MSKLLVKSRVKLPSDKGNNIIKSAGNLHSNFRPFRNVITHSGDFSVEPDTRVMTMTCKRGEPKEIVISEGALYSLVNTLIKYSLILQSKEDSNIYSIDKLETDIL